MASMFSDETTTTGKELFQFRNHLVFQSVKSELTTFSKNVSVFQAKLVSVPAFRSQMLGCFDLGAQQKSFCWLF